jgi:hypothetical protein
VREPSLTSQGAHARFEPIYAMLSARHHRKKPATVWQSGNERPRERRPADAEHAKRGPNIGRISCDSYRLTSGIPGNCQCTG